MNEECRISRAGSEDEKSVWRIIKSCADWLLNIGHDHWHRYYSEERIQKKLNTEEVYLAYLCGNAVGTVSLGTKFAEYYTDVDINTFADPEAKAIYVTGLAVLPKLHRNGIATKLMQFAEGETAKKRISYVRLDCRALYVEW